MESREQGRKTIALFLAEVAAAYLVANLIQYFLLPTDWIVLLTVFSWIPIFLTIDHMSTKKQSKRIPPFLKKERDKPSTPVVKAARKPRTKKTFVSAVRSRWKDSGKPPANWLESELD